jgi:hypothetical protein
VLASIVADDRNIEKSLEKLAVLLRAAGAEIADELVIKCVAGNLSLETPPVRRGSILIRLPQDCLLPLSAFRLSLVNDEIGISSVRSRIRSATVAITDAMFEIYNLAGKLAHHRQTSPWSLIAAHPNLLSYVAPTSRKDFPISVRDIRSGNDTKLMLASFLHSRLFGHRQSERAPSIPVVLPVTDFLNHHWRGEPYSYDGKRAVVMHRSAPLPGRGDECFARYGLHDAYDSWITYGFVDEDVPFVQSVRTTLDLPGAGTIRLGHVSATRESDETEDSAQNAKFYLPRILSKKANHLVVAAVMIPDLQAPRVLRRTLRMLIGELTDRQQNRSDLVMLAEKQIINANLAYYTGLKTCLEGLSLRDAVHGAIRANFVRLCEGQITRLRNYLCYAEG